MGRARQKSAPIAQQGAMTGECWQKLDVGLVAILLSTRPPQPGALPRV